MRFLAFADVRGNPHAASAILQQAKKLDDVEVVCLGNALGQGPDPAACIEKLRKARVHLVRGVWEAAALGMPAPPDVRIGARDLLAKLAPADAAYVRDASPPRRLVAGGKRILLTAEPKPDAGLADVVLHPAPKAEVHVEAGRTFVRVGDASDAEHGESPYVVFDAATGLAKAHYAPWDRALLRRTRQL